MRRSISEKLQMTVVVFGVYELTRMIANSLSSVRPGNLSSSS